MTASGLTVLTRIPCAPPSSARQRARWSEAAFAEEYAAAFAPATRAFFDPTNTSEPPRPCSMSTRNVSRAVLGRSRQEAFGEPDPPQSVRRINLGSPAAAQNAHELVELGLEWLHDIHLDLRHVAAEGRGVAVDQLGTFDVRTRKGQVLGQVVELEH